MRRMRSIRQDIEKDRELRRYCRPNRLLEKDESGKRFKEKPTGADIFYCEACKGPVVDSERARENHVENSPGCRRAMEGKNG